LERGGGGKRGPGTFWAGCVVGRTQEKKTKPGKSRRKGGTGAHTITLCDKKKKKHWGRGEVGQGESQGEKQGQANVQKGGVSFDKKAPTAGRSTPKSPKGEIWKSPGEHKIRKKKKVISQLWYVGYAETYGGKGGG